MITSARYRTLGADASIAPNRIKDLSNPELLQMTQQAACRGRRQAAGRAAGLQRFGAASRRRRATRRRAPLLVLLQPPHPRIHAVRREQAACVPRSTMRPCSSTRISSASTIVDSRCAMVSVVWLRAIAASSAWIAFSDLRIERARRLVEDQDARRLEDRARDGDALLLAAGELEAALADRRRVALGQARR